MIIMVKIILSEDWVARPVLHSICDDDQGDGHHEFIVDEDEYGEYNPEIGLNHVIGANALVDLRTGAVFELFWVFIQSTF